MKGKLELQQQRKGALHESNTRLEKSLQDNEIKRDKELDIFTRKVNKHSEQIHAL
jgi:hypothetical protein